MANVAAISYLFLNKIKSSLSIKLNAQICYYQDFSQTDQSLQPPRQILMDKRVGLKRYELDGRKVLLYFDEVNLAQSDIKKIKAIKYFDGLKFLRNCFLKQ